MTFEIKEVGYPLELVLKFLRNKLFYCKRHCLCLENRTDA